ncbi:MAG: HD domain-containing protein [Deltaproteobacteria bacterium]|nr:HD domain-containing protein [Deltaproteobacteria bacterium]
MTTSSVEHDKLNINEICNDVNKSLVGEQISSSKLMMLSEKARNLLDFLHAAEKLKCIIRHGWTSTGRPESVADHSWRVALMVIFCSRCLDKNINLEKTLKMALIHDIAEIIAGDIPYFLAREGSDAKKIKIKKEQEAMKKIRLMLDKVFGDEIFSLWEEYEAKRSYEARVVKSIDKIEAQIQQNEANLSTWLECEKTDATEGYINQFCNFDSFLKELGRIVVSESEELAKNYSKRMRPESD